MVTLFPKKHSEKLHHPLFKYNCTMYVNITELKKYKHEPMKHVMNAPVDIAIST